jgi:hypothetical protein
MAYTAKEVKKTIFAAIGFVLTVVTTVLALGPDLIPNAALPWIQIGIAVAGTYGVFAARNFDPKAPYKPDSSVAEVDPDKGFNV